MEEMRGIAASFSFIFCSTSFAIRFKLTAIAVSFAWNIMLRRPQPSARAIPWKRFISAFFHSIDARFLYFSRNSSVFCLWLSA